MESTLQFPQVTSSDVRTTWAPLMVEPIIKGPERLVAAVAAISDQGEIGFQRRIDKKRGDALFGSSSRMLGGMIDASLESLNAHLRANGQLRGWRNPFVGVYLGEHCVDYVPSFDAIFELAAQLCSLLGSTPPHTAPVAVRRRGWAEEVGGLVKQLRPGFSNCVNAQLRLTPKDHTVTFTFYGVHLAANVVSLHPGRLTAALREARAHLWNLNLLADAPELLFHPERLELLACTAEDSPDTADAIEELAWEASRRQVEVFSMRTPEDAAHHIVAHAA